MASTLPFIGYCCNYDSGGETVEKLDDGRSRNDDSVNCLVQSERFDDASLDKLDDYEYEGACGNTPPTEAADEMDEGIAISSNVLVQAESCLPTNDKLADSDMPAEAHHAAPCTQETKCTWTAILTKSAPDARLGLTLTKDLTGDQLFIRDIDVCGAPAEDWNKSNPDKKIMPGDMISAVNGKTGNADLLLEEIQGTATLAFELSRETTIRIVRQKQGALGLKLNPHSDMLEVVEVMSGMIREYNKVSKPSREVFPMDRIIEVNGIRGESEALLKGILGISDGQEMQIVISRPGVK